jgi:hypothetical protein
MKFCQLLVPLHLDCHVQELKHVAMGGEAMHICVLVLAQVFQMSQPAAAMSIQLCYLMQCATNLHPGHCSVWHGSNAIVV